MGGCSCRGDSSVGWSEALEGESNIRGLRLRAVRAGRVISNKSIALEMYNREFASYLRQKDSPWWSR